MSSSVFTCWGGTAFSNDSGAVVVELMVGTQNRDFYSIFSVGCVIPHDRPRFPFNDMEISMIDICILDILIISILELFHAFFHAHKRGKAHFSALMSMEKLHAYHLGL